MKIIVTGCVGFIGSNLTEQLLNEGHKIIGIDNFNDYYDIKRKKNNFIRLSKISLKNFPNNLDIKHSEVLESTSFMDPDIDIIYHLASRANVRHSLKFPLQYVEDNIKTMIYILDCLKKRKEQGLKIPLLIYASSSSVYGSSKEIPFKEDNSLDCIESPYALSKKVCEEYASLYNKLYGIKSIGLRFFTVYGPHGRPDMAPEKFLTNIYLGKEITKYGDGMSQRDYTFIDDIVQGLIKSMYVENVECDVFNLGNNSIISLNDFITLCENIVGKKAIIKQLDNQKGDVPITYANIDKSKQILGYNPNTNLEQGLTKTFEWLKEYLDKKEN